MTAAETARIADAARERGRRERRQQGIPPHVTAPGLTARLVSLLRRSDRDALAEAESAVEEARRYAEEARLSLQAAVADGPVVSAVADELRSLREAVERGRSVGASVRPATGG